ncbi:MAG: helix-turn-helix transcriptional regulator [Lachnospiraceae bacterium]|nr:helix-turn-helix transcriptional regulator [Lachnospiraceae bacterium]
MFRVNYSGYDVSDRNYYRVFRPFGSGDYLLVFFLTETDVTFPDGIETAQMGSVAIFTPGELQDFAARREFHQSYVHFTCKSEEFLKYGIPTNTIFRLDDPTPIDHYLSRLNTEYYSQIDFADEAMDISLRRLFIYIAREMKRCSLETEREQKLYKLFCQARFTMLSNCEREWASTNMSQMVGLSRSQFYKYYIDFFGISPMADLQRARIEKAKNLLTNKELQVTEVAERCGYASIHHFSRTFKEHTGKSPLQYVKDVAAFKLS